MKLTEENSIPVTGNTTPMSFEAALELAKEIPGWLLQEKSLKKDFMFKDFNQAMAFVNGIARIADHENHHPDMCVYYNKVQLSISTHKVNGLTRNDFILAAKISTLPRE